MSLAALGVPFYFLAVAVVVFASFLFYLEQQGARMNGDCQAGNCGAAFHSIPHAIWFMLVTMTTVGYGDVSPNTELGRMVTVFAMIFGVLFLSMPLAIVGNNFAAIWEDRSRVIFIEKFKESFATKKVDRATLQTVFEDLDTDGSGTLSFKELKVSLTKINVRMSAYAFKQLWRAIDSDNSGEIGFEEFTRLFFEARARAARRARRGARVDARAIARARALSSPPRSDSLADAEDALLLLLLLLLLLPRRTRPRPRTARDPDELEQEFEREIALDAAKASGANPRPTTPRPSSRRATRRAARARAAARPARRARCSPRCCSSRTRCSRRSTGSSTSRSRSRVSCAATEAGVDSSTPFCGIPGLVRASARARAASTAPISMYARARARAPSPARRRRGLFGARVRGAGGERNGGGAGRAPGIYERERDSDIQRERARELVEEASEARAEREA